MIGKRVRVWSAPVVLSVLLAGCGGGSGSSGGDDLAPAQATAGVVDAQALSNHYVEVGFAGAAGDDARDPGSYVITDPDGGPLAVEAVQVSDDRTQAILTTDGQEAVEYRLTLRAAAVQTSAVANQVATSAEVIFTGSIQLEPFVASAISLSANEILLTFSEKMDAATVEDVRFYEIAAPDLAISAAVLQADGTTAILTTSTQDNVAYAVRVTNVTNKTGQLINPILNEAEFSGIPPVDDIRPTLMRAESTSATTVLLWFSEPLADGADDPTHYQICMSLDPNCSPATQLVITDAELTAQNTRVVLTTLPQVAGIEYRVEVHNVVDRATPPPANSIDPGHDSSTFTFAGTPGVDDGTTAPRVVGAASLGNTSAVVTFSKPMGDSALNLANYVIVQVNVNPEVGALAVISGQRVRDGGNGIAETTANGDDVQIYELNAGVTPGAILVRQGDDGDLTTTAGGDDVVEDLPAPHFASPERTAVVLTTLSQGEVTYEVTVVNVRDLAGNGLAPPQLLVEPSKATFPGTPPGSETELLDSDGDGMADRDEQSGWVVTVHLANGDVRRTEVTGSPFKADSDGDGLTDLEEWSLLLNPRLADTDGDGVTDYDEYNVWFSEPALQDTDGDGITDGLEIKFFFTSALIADTDGDQMSDAEELFELNRDPRVADLPRPRIIIGDAALRLDTRFSFTDTQGVSRTSEESVETTLAKSQSESFSRSDSSTSERVIENTTKAGTETEGDAGLSSLIKGPTITVSAETEFKFGFTDTETTTVDRESAEEASQTYQESLTTSETIDETQEVTREVMGASIQIPLSVGNNGDIPFTLTNLEVTALLQDPRDRTRFVPVATLVPESALDTGEIPTINTGPFLPERGPFIFTSREIFPSLVEDLLRDPRGLIFEVANFDITDESGRNLAFVSQEVNDRTAGIVIDYGNRAEHFRVATNSTFDEDGRPVGITLGYALQDILRMEKSGDPDAITVGPDGCGVTQAVGDDVQVAVPACPPVMPGGAIVDAGANGIVDSIPRGDDFIKLDVNDNMQKIFDGGDGCAHSRAFADDVQLVGQCDAGALNAGTSCSSDGDCMDGTCVGACTVGGVDGEIVTAGPNGVLDTMSPGGDDEITTITGYATEIVGLCDGQSVSPGATCIDDFDCQDAAHAAGECRQLTEIPTRVHGVRRKPEDAQFWLVLSSADFDVSTDFDDIPLHAGDRISLAFVQDKDDDGLIARQEFLHGSSDSRVNTDDCAPGTPCEEGEFDTLTDFEEVVLGWQVQVEGQPARTVYSDPARPDSDGDRLADHREFLLGTDPRKRDTDDDGISDFDEVKGFPILDKFRQSAVAVIVPYEGDFPIGGIQAVIDGGNGIAETEAAKGLDGVLLDEQVILVDKSVSAFGVVVQPGDDAVLDTTMVGGDDEVRSGQEGKVAHDAFFATDPLNRDTDGDGLLDGVERALGANPNDPSDADDFRDNDFDGLVNAQEREGWPLFQDELRVTVDSEVLSFCKAATPPLKMCDQASITPDDPCTSDANCADADHLSGRCVDRLVLISDRQDPPGDCAIVTVTSDPFEPDTDFDGLPDLLESILRTNPRVRDSDGDGLLDFDEFNPESPFSIDFAAFRDFEDLCFVADQCFYDPVGSRLFGTDLAASDSDGDGRTDPLELFRGWTVSPFGKLPYVVMSSPVDADADRDGANDLQEHANATDPGNADTDGDGALDGSDANPTGFGKGIFVRLESWNVGDDDCDKGAFEGWGDFRYRFEVNRILPDGTVVTEVLAALGAPNFIELGTVEDSPAIDKNLELPLNETLQLTLNSGEILELKVDIDEIKVASELDPTTNWTGKEQYNYSSVATGEVVMSADSGCFSDDKVRWFISVGN